MNDKRKRIFKESLFLIPFMLIAAAVSFVMMFGVGRTVRDVMEIISGNFSSNSSMDISDYAENDSKKYTLKYYYGEQGESTQYAEYTMNAKGDEPVYSLTLYETRDGFDAGYYMTEWFHSVEYVTYAPLDDPDNTSSYIAEDESSIYDYILSYSYENLLNDYGALDEVSKGYKILGLINLYTWDSSDRTNCVWGIGGRPLQFYTYLNDNTTEYKKVTVK